MLQVAANRNSQNEVLTNMDTHQLVYTISRPQKVEKRNEVEKKTYNTEDSLVVTDPTTSSALRSLCTGERTGPSIFCELWSYVSACPQI